jgi:hypothetical protein
MSRFCWFRLLGLVLLVWFNASVGYGQAVRVTVDNVCGSGSVCGRDFSTEYILTNAHVAGTRIGRSVNVQFDDNGSRRSVVATIVASAYSSTALADWALLRTDGLPDEYPVAKLSRSFPNTTIPYRTCGSPRCVWPLVCQDVTTRSLDRGTGLWRWRPNSIGGQSGSAVRDGLVSYGLLTWSWGGDGAGQATAVIAKQLDSGQVDASALRPVGLVETAVVRSPTEEGVFCEVASDFPIWEDTPDVPVVDPGKELKQAAEAAGVDFVELVRLILQIIALFRRS